MSVIEDALRRAQGKTSSTTDDASATTKPVIEPAVTAQSIAVVHGAPAPAMAKNQSASTSTTRGVASPRRQPSLATVILLILTITTLVTISQPGWGQGFERWWGSSATPSSSPLRPMAITPLQTDSIPLAKPIENESTPTRSETGSSGKGIASSSLLGPPIDLAELLPPECATPMSTAASSTPNSSTAAESAVLDVPALPSKSSPVEDERSPVQASAPTPAPRLVAPKPKRSVESILQDYRLSGIMMTGGKRMAVINGVILNEGGTLGAAKVKRVTRRGVILQVDGETVDIPLRGNP